MRQWRGRVKPGSDLPTTAFTWIPPASGDPGQLEISNDKLNDARWMQSTTLEPGLYYAGAEISTQGVPPQSWAGALVSVGDQQRRLTRRQR